MKASFMQMKIIIRKNSGSTHSDLCEKEAENPKLNVKITIFVKYMYGSMDHRKLYIIRRK